MAMQVEVVTKEQALSLIRQNRAEIMAAGVHRLGLFGSFIREEARADSDVDLLVEFAPGQKTFDNFMQLAFYLEDLLGRRVELVTPESLSPHIRPYIMREIEYVAISN